MWRFPMMLLAVSLVACGAPTIDASDAETMEFSVAEVKNSLDPELRPAFDSAMTVVAMSGLDAGELFGRAFAAAFGEEEEAGEINAMSGLAGSVMTEVDGLTGMQVIQRSDSILLQAAEERLTSLQEQIEESRAAVAEEEAEAEMLAGLVLDNPRVQVDRGGFMSTARVVLQATNNLDKTVESFFLSIEIRSPEREVPWEDEDDVYVGIDGGLEPGESRELFGYLESKWTRLELPGGTEQEATVTRIGFADDTSVGSMSMMGFGSSSAAEELAELEGRLSQVQEELARRRALER